MFVPASTFSCPAVRFRLVMREMFNLRHPYWMPRDVVAEKALLLGVYVWTALAFRFRFRLPVLESSEVPGKPSLGSNCSSGGKNRDRKSTRLNSSHLVISYAVFCLKKKKKQREKTAR